MTPGNGRPDAQDSPADRARIDYLAGNPDTAVDSLPEADRAELDELRALLADPTLWAEPPAALEDSVVAAIAAEAAALPPLDQGFASAPESEFDTGLDRPTETVRRPDTIAEFRPPAAPPTGFTAPPPTGFTPAPPPTGFPPAPPRTAGSPVEPPVDPTGPPGPTAPADLSAARRRRAERSSRPGWRRPTMLVAAAAAIAAVVVSGLLLLRPPAQRTFDVAFQPTELAPTASGTAVMLKSDSGWEIKLNVTGLPRLDNGRFYQGWLRNADGVLVPIGTFNEGTDVVLWSGVSPDAFPTMTITQEEADGNQDSSGQRVLVGTAVEVK